MGDELSSRLDGDVTRSACLRCALSGFWCVMSPWYACVCGLFLPWNPVNVTFTGENGVWPDPAAV